MKAKKPILIINSGLIATGKSTVARALVEKIDVEILSSDVVRKELAGIPLREHRYENFGGGIYSKEFSEKTYLHLIKRARKLLLEGKSVILDACFSKKWERQKAFDITNESSANFLLIEYVCPDEVIKARLKKRYENKKGVSDGRREIYQIQKNDFEKIDEFSNERHLVIDTTKTIQQCVNEIVEKLENME